MTEDKARREADLVRRCAAGDEDAWASFVDAYGPLLTALARRMLARRLGRADDADVDEVVGEVFLALLRREGHLLRRYDPTWRLSTYLGVICRTEVGRLLRRRRRTLAPLGRGEEVPAPRDAAGGLAGLTEEERREVLAKLRAGLDALAPRDRLLLRLRYLDGLDYRAIAEAVGVSPESVGQLLHRAKRRLAARVGGLEEVLDDET